MSIPDERPVATSPVTGHPTNRNVEPPPPLRDKALEEDT